MRRYSYLEHICDIRLKVEADSMEELFKAALDGMNSIIAGGAAEGLPESFERRICVESMDYTCLLVDFLSEVLLLTHSHYNIFSRIEIESLSSSRLEAVLHGRRVEEFDEDIKAVTYHEAEVVKNSQGNYESVIVFDI
ncbi:hypothetical protein EAL2_c15250 [Peptoclostridium acidaminophilum DSM 3953]|uniref:Archease domain-containing protein n=1 Tax=Peptoclostridium acidaminophilum DSM 3953 TaxID=1286171 RepID=W8T7F1_PEPAC|nr:archease [Peptoclostridium acidaminophilum]AHM56820.1 hypothetical protein EAL2_c15250 [Peptoclostridium acidaminophilum DSM 3953]